MLADGERVPADAIVMNGDVAALAAGLLGEGVAGAAPPTPREARSLSATTWAIAAKTAGFPLIRHNVFFSGDYRAEFDDIFRIGRLPRRPTVYVCAQDRGDADAPPGAAERERLLCLVNAPAVGDTGPIDPAEAQACEEATFEQLSRCGLTIERRPEATVVTTPAEFAALFPATGGALYGRASHGWMASFARPGSRTRLPGLYLAGGSVHPGPGVPMAALSGREAATSVIADLVSTEPVAAGGYAWWYVDALSDDGQFGLTIIAFLGSVFSPYYAWSRRRDPLDHCAVNVALYGPRGARWAMTERGRASGARRDRLAIGRSALSWDGAALNIDLDESARRSRGASAAVVRVEPEFLHPGAFALEARAATSGGRSRRWRG